MVATILTTSTRVYRNDVFEEQIVRFNLQDIASFDNWLCNRQPDQDKVLEIISSIKSHKFTPQLISTFQKDDRYVVYDGSHRVEAFKQMLASDELSKTLVSYLNDTLLACVILSKNEKFIVERFTEINKATPLPELYKQPLEISTQEIRAVVPQFVLKFKKMYKCHKTTAKPHLPNYNASTLTDQVYEILTSDAVSPGEELTPDLLMNVFAVINTSYKQKFLERPTSIRNGLKIVNKAEECGCFIFLGEWQKDFVEIYNRLTNNDQNLIEFA